MKKISPKMVLKLISYWPPYLFSGIKVLSVSDDLLEVVVRLKSSFWNKNYYGTHYGGSLYSMTDPFFVFMLSHQLGKGYILWDQAAEIKFKKAIKDQVTITFRLNEQDVQKVKEMTAEGRPYRPVYSANIIGPNHELIAEVSKTLYVKKVT